MYAYLPYIFCLGFGIPLLLLGVRQARGMK